MILILEDNPEKIRNLLYKFGNEHLPGNRVVIVDSVADAKAVCRLMPMEELNLWLDNEVKGSETGTDFLQFILAERKHWLESVMLITLNRSAQSIMKALCEEHGVAHTIWAGPFG